MNNTQNFSIIVLDPYEGHYNSIKWIVSLVYILTLMCSVYISQTIWLEMIQRKSIYTFLPFTQEIAAFSIIEVRSTLLSIIPNSHRVYLIELADVLQLNCCWYRRFENMDWTPSAFVMSYLHHPSGVHLEFLHPHPLHHDSHQVCHSLDLETYA